jgi:hypothetical protein
MPLTPKQQLAVMQEVVKLLTDAGVEAYFEVPGYIGTSRDGHEIAFGTANGDWGWNDEDGNGGDLGIRGNERDAALITSKITDIVRQGAFGFHNAPKT